MACPFFIPYEPHTRELWPHRDRLPLGDGFAGGCGVHAPGTSCDDETVRSSCNLGYAECAHLPADRTFDAIRFLVQIDRTQSESPQCDKIPGESSAILRVQFTGELAHLPAFAGELHYNQVSQTWLEAPDPRLIPLAYAAVRAWILRHATHAPPSAATDSTLQTSKVVGISG